MVPEQAGKRPTFLFRASGLAAWLLVVPSCSPSSGPGASDGGPEGGPADASDARIHDAPHDVLGDIGLGEGGVCDECLASHCAPEFTVCAKVADCLAIAECAGDKLGSPGCACDHPAGVTAYLDLATCELAEACSPDCKSACLNGEIEMTCEAFDSGLEFMCDGEAPVADASSQGCSGCVNVSCAEQSGRCGEGSDCVAYETCLFACRPDDTRCPASCQMQDPEGYGLAESLFDCEMENCGGLCGL